jgi:hypothetical protein
MHMNQSFGKKWDILSKCLMGIAAVVGLECLWRSGAVLPNDKNKN